MNKTSDHFLSRDGLKIFYRHWKIDNPEKIFCIVHGLGEHSGRYDHVAEALTKSSITTFALDLRGHGQSEGKRGHAKNLDILLADIEELMKVARVNYNSIPMILFGHSMGGNLVASLVAKKPTNEISAFILSAPWIKLAFEPPKWKTSIGGFIAHLLPSFTQPNDLDTNSLSKDPIEVQKYEEDPLVHSQISAGLFKEISESGITLQQTEGIEIKGLCYHGLADKIIDPNASKQFALKNNLAWIGLENVYHEPHNDTERDIVIKNILDWLKTVE